MGGERASEMAVTESSEEARIAESSRSVGGRRRLLRVQRERNSRVGSVNATPVVSLASSADAGSGEVINLASSGDERSGDDAGGSHVNHDDGVTLTRTQQGLPNTPTVRRTGNQADLTPNFRSAAAMAGWDDEALLMAASGRGTPEAHLCANSCEGCPQCRERKRVTRTPGQAATPLSAGRRYRRLRRVNGEPLAPIPMATYTDDKCGEPGREATGSQQKPSEGKENKDTETCTKTASVKASAEAAEGKAVKNESLQLDKLREELTCVVCLDICFEPSTTSCGHSFCRGCLQSVYIKCGSRCPKCREDLRATSQNDCPINTVLWNTIQLLFPQEAAARMKDQKSNKNERDKETLRSVEAESQLRLGGVRRRIVRPVPWRELGAGTRPGNVQTSFRRASEVTEYPPYPHGFLRLRVQRPTTAAWRSPDIQRQEEEDAALAARLQESFISEAAGL